MLRSGQVVILLDDADDIEYNAGKLRQFDFNSDINEILTCLSNNEYSSRTLKSLRLIVRTVAGGKEEILL